VIGRLRGKIRFLSEEQILVDVHGIGYLVSIPTSTRAQLRDDAEATLLIYTQVREDAILLYGFATLREKEVFELLITVSGVGPKLALSVLSTLAPEAFCQAVLQGNLKALTRVPGIGKRTGERLIVELKDRIAKQFPAWGVSQTVSERVSGVASEALDALLALGYGDAEAREALSQLQLDGTETLEAVLKGALGLVMRLG